MIEKIPLKITTEPRRRVRIAKAAIRHGEDVYTGWRHSDILSHMRYIGLERLSCSGAEQGFVDEDGFFYERYMSAKIAGRCGQITSIKHGTLMSEELWDNDGKPNDAGKPFNPRGY